MEVFAVESLPLRPVLTDWLNAARMISAPFFFWQPVAEVCFDVMPLIARTINTDD